ncbi:MAG: hypothetical protein PW792_04310 [Acidobacteriaceae bacterium]|nr:hypothetical protein [Acidobacteriaceae bacterium]
MLKKIAIAAAFVLTSAAIAQTQEIRGTVTDSMCGKHHMMKNASAAECTRACVKSGSEFALVVGDKLYTLKGDKAQIDKVAGSNVRVRGDVNGTTITVKEIKAAS